MALMTFGYCSTFLPSTKNVALALHFLSRVRIYGV